MEHNLEERRGTEKGKLGWMDGVTNDFKKFGIKNWWTVAKFRKLWRKALKKVEPRIELYL